ncbi:hypothetical protein NDU88_011961 [Pleurodeles waltl]|uniref:Uncharacterized protein n=1 Tax=Pleurodeles waltl TaxID=8319 RepID=A0AAV7R2X8_PLEWA|nr:hypothetical protein NDU88_011961 [Pleurodeles waltl]
MPSLDTMWGSSLEAARMQHMYEWRLSGHGLCWLSGGHALSVHGQKQWLGTGPAETPFRPKSIICCYAFFAHSAGRLISATVYQYMHDALLGHSACWLISATVSRYMHDAFLGHSACWLISATVYQYMHDALLGHSACWLISATVSRYMHDAFLGHSACWLISATVYQYMHDALLGHSACWLISATVSRYMQSSSDASFRQSDGCLVPAAVSHYTHNVLLGHSAGWLISVTISQYMHRYPLRARNSLGIPAPGSHTQMLSVGTARTGTFQVTLAHRSEMVPEGPHCA